MSFIYSIVVTLSTNHIFQYCVCIYVCWFFTVGMTHL
jgi:hypothetical protein